MQHGGNTTPSAAFSGGRTLNLPAQTNLGTSPILTTGTITSLTANNATGTTNVNWTIDEYKSPQLSAKIEIFDALKNVVKTLQDTLPQRRNVAINYPLTIGSYTARVTIRDIFNQLSHVATTTFSVTGVLPLKLLCFKGQSDGKYANLQWQTNDEINTSHFNVQRSIDGINFLTVNTQQAANNSSTTNNYNYKDDASNTIVSKVYYRLQMAYKDGKSYFSNIVTINISRKGAGFEISPNPAKSAVTVNGQNLKHIVIIDQLGNTVLRQALIDSKTVINVSSLPKGVYTFLVTDINKQVYAEKIIVE